MPRTKRNREDQAINDVFIQSCRERMTENPHHLLAQNAVNNVGIKWASLNHSKLHTTTHQFDYTVRDRKTRACDQGYTGRCWMFAGLNILRHQLINKLTLSGNFELSEAYLFFWDKFERANCLLESAISNPEFKLGSQLSHYMTHLYLSDGGYWNFFANLVNKYGLVPKTCMNDTLLGGWSNEMNYMLKQYVLTGLSEICNKKVDLKRRRYPKKHIESELSAIKGQVMTSVYQLLVKCLGQPPSKFTWIFTQKGIKRTLPDITPLEFKHFVCVLVYPEKLMLPSEIVKLQEEQNKKLAEISATSIIETLRKIINNDDLDESDSELQNPQSGTTDPEPDPLSGLSPLVDQDHESDEKDYTLEELLNQPERLDLSEFVVLTNATSSKIKPNKLYQIKHTTNVYEQPTHSFLNVSSDDLKKYARDSLLTNIPVWFAGDVNHQFNFYHGIMDENLYSTDLLFGQLSSLEKSDRLDVQQLSANHAMVLTGLNFGKDNIDTPDGWQVENSWGYYNSHQLGKDGYMYMSNEWFDKYVVEIVVHQSILSRHHRNLLKSNPIVLKPWESVATSLMVDPSRCLLSNKETQLDQ